MCRSVSAAWWIGVVVVVDVLMGLLLVGMLLTLALYLVLGVLLLLDVMGVIDIHALRESRRFKRQLNWLARDGRRR